MQETNLNMDGLLNAFADVVASKLADRMAAGPAGGKSRRRLLTVDEAAEYLGRTKEAVQHMIASGKLRTVRADRRVFLDIKDLDLWIDQNKF
jgi:excisionase family DNA binding protein